MNRLSEIRSTNPHIQFRKKHSKQDNIWHKQFNEDERSQLRKPDLGIYPTQEEIVKAWQKGIDMAKEKA